VGAAVRAAGERSIDIEQHEASPDWQPAWAATEAVVQRPASSGEVHRGTHHRQDVPAPLAATALMDGRTYVEVEEYDATPNAPGAAAARAARGHGRSGTTCGRGAGPMARRRSSSRAMVEP